MYLDHSGTFFSLMNQMLEAQGKCTNHMIKVHHVYIHCMNLGQDFHFVCTILISIN